MVSTYALEWLKSNFDETDTKYLQGIDNITSADEIFNHALSTKVLKSFVMIPCWDKALKSLYYQAWVYLPHLLALLNHIIEPEDDITEKTFDDISSHIKPFTATMHSDIVITPSVPLDDIRQMNAPDSFISVADTKKIIDKIISSYQDIGNIEIGKNILITLEDINTVGNEVIPNLIYLVLYYKLRVAWGEPIVS